MKGVPLQKLFLNQATPFFVCFPRLFLNFGLVLSFLTSYFLGVDVNLHTCDKHSYFNCIPGIMFVCQLKINYK